MGSRAEELVLDAFRRLRDTEPEKFALAPAVIAAADDVSDEAKARALDRLRQVAQEQQ